MVPKVDGPGKPVEVKNLGNVGWFSGIVCRSFRDQFQLLMSLSIYSIISLVVGILLGFLIIGSFTDPYPNSLVLQVLIKLYK